jgi:septal ring factor EnvC (AmiA/AmiB activator)
MTPEDIAQLVLFKWVAGVCAVILALLGSAMFGFLAKISRAIEALERHYAVIAEKHESLEGRVSNTETAVKENTKAINGIEKTCAVFHHHRRNTDSNGDGQ